MLKKSMKNIFVVLVFSIFMGQVIFVHAQVDVSSMTDALRNWLNGIGSAQDIFNWVWPNNGRSSSSRREDMSSISCYWEGIVDPLVPTPDGFILGKDASSDWWKAYDESTCWGRSNPYLTCSASSSETTCTTTYEQMDLPGGGITVTCNGQEYTLPKSYARCYEIHESDPSAVANPSKTTTHAMTRYDSEAETTLSYLSCCVPECVTAAQCDDGNPCTVGSCTASRCEQDIISNNNNPCSGDGPCADQGVCNSGYCSQMVPSNALECTCDYGLGAGVCDMFDGNENARNCRQDCTLSCESYETRMSCEDYDEGDPCMKGILGACMSTDKYAEGHYTYPGGHQECCVTPFSYCDSSPDPGSRGGYACYYGERCTCWPARPTVSEQAIDGMTYRTDEEVVQDRKDRGLDRIPIGDTDCQNREESSTYSCYGYLDPLKPVGVDRQL